MLETVGLLRDVSRATSALLVVSLEAISWRQILVLRARASQGRTISLVRKKDSDGHAPGFANLAGAATMVLS